MSTLLIGPHDDDIPLFCSIPAQRTRGTILVCLDSYLQPARGEIGCSAQERAAESERAHKILGCETVRLFLHDDNVTDDQIYNALVALQEGYEVVYAPALQGGNEQHDAVSRAADKVFGTKVIHYQTYTKDELYTTGAFEVAITAEELWMKNAALYHFESQLRVNFPHFQAVLGKSEWLDRDPASISTKEIGPVRVHLGCGSNILPGYINIDRMDLPGVTYRVDICYGIPCGNNEVDYLVSQDFLEHLPPEKKVFVINEIWRVLKPGGIMEHNVPNAGSQNDFGSPTHLSHWSLQQFDHWNVDSYRHAKDKQFEGITGGFKMLVRERVNLMKEEDGVERYQSIHVKMEAVK